MWGLRCFLTFEDTVPPFPDTIGAMYYLYVLKGRMQHKLYIGSTNDLRRRLAEHVRGKSPYTSKSTGWELVYYEAYRNREDARERERLLKNFGSAYGHLKKRIARSIGSERAG